MMITIDAVGPVGQSISRKMIFDMGRFGNLNGHINALNIRALHLSSYLLYKCIYLYIIYAYIISAQEHTGMFRCSISFIRSGKPA